MKRILCLGLILSIAFCGAFASESECGSKGPCVKKKDFIPDRCGLSGVRPICDEDMAVDWYGEPQHRPLENYPACVCFWDGRCEFRSDHSRCYWCHYGGAVSVNEGQRCPDLQGASLHVCPIRYDYPPPMTQPGFEDPVIYIDDPVPFVDVMPAVDEPIAIDVQHPILLAGDSVDRVAAKKKQESLTSPIRVRDVSIDPVPIKPVPIADPIDLPVEPIVEPIEPIYPIRQPPIIIPNGCICTDDGVCTESYVNGATLMCDNDERLVAVVENGPCPRSSSCKLQAPKDTYICQDSDRATDDFLMMCPEYLSLYGCICYHNGRCENHSTNTCKNCQDPNVVSVSSAQCVCI